MTIILIRKSKDDSFRVGFIEFFEGLLGSFGFFVIVGEKEQGRLFILEYFFDGVVVEGEDLRVDVQDEEEG